MKIWQNAFNLYFDKTSLSELQEDTTTTTDNFTSDLWTTLQVFSKLFKENLLRELREHKRANRLLSRCGLVGARFAQQCNIFAPILLFCILDLFLLIYRDIGLFCKEDLDLKILRIVTFSHKFCSWP